MKNEEEKQALELLGQFHYLVVRQWGLKTDTNVGPEFLAALHVLQGFVISHMLQRIEPGEWGNWYRTLEPTERKPPLEQANIGWPKQESTQSEPQAQPSKESQP